jgi:hypothetical protein
LGDLNVDGLIILKYSLKKYGVRIRNGFIWLMIETSGGSCEHGIECSDSIKIREFIDLLSDYLLLSSVELVKGLKKKHEEKI